MLNRRAFDDDYFGVGQGHNEEAYGKPLVAGGWHRVHVGEAVRVSFDYVCVMMKCLIEIETIHDFATRLVLSRDFA